MYKRSFLIIRILDITSIIVSYLLAAALRYYSFSNMPKRVFYELLFVFLLTYGIITFFTVHKRRPRFEEFMRVIGVNASLGAASVFLFYMFQSSRYIPRSILTLFLLFNTVFMVLIRMYVREKSKKELSMEQVLILAESEQAMNEAVAIVKYRKPNANIIREINTNKIDNIQDFNLVKIPFDIIVINMPNTEYSKIMELVHYVERMGITCVRILPDELPGEYYCHVTRLKNSGVIIYKRTNYSGEMLAIKRTMDVIGGIVGVIITGILTVIIGPLIKLDSKGSVFFSQTRIGRNGREFKIYKFRTMRNDAEAQKAALMKENKMNGLMFKMDDDPRITRIGKFLRKTSLDEFPQFFNVLKGDMSLVGTRPPTKDEFEGYNEYYRRRLSMMPGLTGVWQVSGRSNVTDFEDVVKMDLDYIDHWSVMLDIKIILQTIIVMLTGRGAS